VILGSHLVTRSIELANRIPAAFLGLVIRVYTSVLYGTAQSEGPAAIR
jgi:hypothetical protein